VEEEIQVMLMHILRAPQSIGLRWLTWMAGQVHRNLAIWLQPGVARNPHYHLLLEVAMPLHGV
jgi:hypothetical protein